MVEGEEALCGLMFVRLDKGNMLKNTRKLLSLFLFATCLGLLISLLLTLLTIR